MTLRPLLLAGVASLALTTSAFAAPVQSVGGENSNNAGSYCTGAGNNCVTPAFTAIGTGDTIVGYVNTAVLANLTSITDNASGSPNTYVIESGTPQYDGYGVWNVPFYGVNITGGPTILTFHFSAQTAGGFHGFEEFSGVSAVDAFAQAYVPTSAAPSVSLTTTQSGDTIFGMLNPAGGTVSAGAGFTFLNNNNLSGGIYTEDKIQSTPGSVVVSFADNSAVNQSIIAFALAPLPTPTGVTYTPPSPNIAVGAASGATIAGFVVTTSNSTTYAGTDSLLSGSDALCTAPSTNNGNLTLSRTTVSGDVGSHVCKLQVSENSTNLEVDLTFMVQGAALSETGGGSLAPSINGDVVGVVGGAFTLTVPTAGQAATVSVGTVTSGSPAAVTNSGTSNAAVLNFTIPPGTAGTNGTNGTNGTDAGQNTYPTCPTHTAAATIGQAQFCAGIANPNNTYIAVAPVANTWLYSPAFTATQP